MGEIVLCSSLLRRRCLGSSRNLRGRLRDEEYQVTVYKWVLTAKPSRERGGGVGRGVEILLVASCY